MQIVIDIDENIYKGALVYKDTKLTGNNANDLAELTIAVANGIPLLANGIPLPKHYGMLIDASDGDNYRANRIIDVADEYAEEKVTTVDDVLGKIRAEIEQLTSRYSISKERGGMGIVEWSDRLIKESDVLQIIDKYKAESEDKE